MISPSVTLNLNAAGQWAFAPLTNSMGFSLGSDTGLRGLPGSLMSGDTGWLGTTELSWTFWRNRNQALQLVPFIGVGGIESTRHNVTVNDTVGSGGVLARWIAGKQWQIELGWSDQFEADDNSGFWNNWLLGNGVYGNVKFRF
jgi:hemolysin activation/secretion protein